MVQWTSKRQTQKVETPQDSCPLIHCNWGCLQFMFGNLHLKICYTSLRKGGVKGNILNGDTLSGQLWWGIPGCISLSEAFSSISPWLPTKVTLSNKISKPVIKTFLLSTETCSDEYINSNGIIKCYEDSLVAAGFQDRKFKVLSWWKPKKKQLWCQIKCKESCERFSLWGYAFCSDWNVRSLLQNILPSQLTIQTFFRSKIHADPRGQNWEDNNLATAKPMNNWNKREPAQFFCWNSHSAGQKRISKLNSIESEKELMLYKVGCLVFCSELFFSQKLLQL